jgi:hypothetical protein
MEMGDGGGSDDDESHLAVRKGKNNMQTARLLQRRTMRIKGAASRLGQGG